MKKSLQQGWFVVSLCIGLFFTGCSLSSSFYKVTDLQSGKEYYTQGIDHLASGAVVVKDTRTDSIITLQNSQVKKITSDEYKAALAASGNQPAQATPASAPSGTN